MAELGSSWSATERLLWSNFLVLERKILKLRILQQPSSINSPEQTLRMLSPAAASDPLRILDTTYSGNPAASRLSLSRSWDLDLKLFAQRKAENFGSISKTSFETAFASSSLPISANVLASHTRGR